MASILKTSQFSDATQLVRFAVIDFEDVFFVVNCDRIQALDSKFIKFDTLNGHNASITALDVSSRGIVISSSGETICFHVPSDASKPLKWELSFKTKLEGNLTATCLRISQIDDFCVLAGHKFLALWTQDSNGESFSQQIFYSSNQAINDSQQGQVLEVVDSLTGTIQQIEIDQRMFFSLEQGANRIKVWYQDLLQTAPKSQTVRRQLVSDLSMYQTPAHQAEINSFKLKHKCLNTLNIEPLMLITMTKREILLWVENLTDSDMRFDCQCRLPVQQSVFDCAFIQLKRDAHPLSFSRIEVWHSSKLFDTFRDEELKLKKLARDNQFGLVPNFSSHESQGLLPSQVIETLLDWIIIVIATKIFIYKCRGMSNFPPSSNPLELVKTINTSEQMKLLQPSFLYQAVQLETDQVLMTLCNKKGQLFKVSFDVRSSQILDDLTTSQMLWTSLSKVLICENHSQLSLTAVVYEDNSVSVFNKHVLFGVWENQEAIKMLQWVPSLNIFIVLLSQSVRLVSSSPQGKRGVLDAYVGVQEVKVIDVVAISIVKCAVNDQSISLHFGTISSLGQRSVYLISFDNTSTYIATQFDNLHQSLTHQSGDYPASHKITQVINSASYQDFGYLLVLSVSQRALTVRSGAKQLFTIRLHKFQEQSEQEIFKVDLPNAHPIISRIGPSCGMLAISVVQGDYAKYKHVCYLFKDLNQAQNYTGYINLTDLLHLPVDKEDKACALDLKILSSNEIMVCSEQSIYLIVNQYGIWNCAASFKYISWIPKTILMFEGGVLLNRRYFIGLEQLPLPQSCSLVLHHPIILKTLFLKGYYKQVAKILYGLYSNLKNGTPLLDQQLIQFAEEAQPVKKKAFSAFDAFEESESEGEVADVEMSDKDTLKLFLKTSDDLIVLLCDKSKTFQLSKEETILLIDFVYKFRKIHAVEFYSDVLASHLLRQINLETEIVESIDIEYCKSQLGLIDSAIERPVVAVKEFSMEEFINKRLAGNDQVQKQVDVTLLKDWDSRKICLALHSDNQDVILDQVSLKFSFDKNLTWDIMKRLGIPLWLKQDFKLKNLLELIAPNEYRLSNGEEGKSKAEASSLWYVLTNKVSVLRKLFNVEKDGTKFAEFLDSDFSQPKPKVVAGKNAMALIGKKRYLLSCSFFLLASDLQSAVQVATDRMNDPILAVLMCRLHDPKNESKVLEKVVEWNFLQRGKTFNDPYLRSIGRWLQKEYVKAANELAVSENQNSIEQFLEQVPEFNLTAARKSVKSAQATYPIVSLQSYESLDLMVKLKKSPDVKRMLNKNWALDDKPKSKKGGSIFDDFMGSEEESQEEEQPIEQITVDEAQILSSVIADLLLSGQTPLAQILIQEQKDLVPKLNVAIKEAIGNNLILDIIFANMNEPSKIFHGIKEIKNQLRVDINTDYVLDKLRKFDLFKTEIEFISELNKFQSSDERKIKQLQRIEEQSNTMIEFMQSSIRFGGRQLKARSVEQFEKILGYCDRLLVIVDCLLIQSSQPEETIADETNSRQPQLTKQVFQKQPTRIGALLESSDEAEIADEPQNNSPHKSPTLRTSKLVLNSEETMLMLEIACKYRSSLILIASSFQICMLIEKFSLFEPFTKKLEQICAIKTNSALDAKQLCQTLKKFNFSELKQQIQMIRASVVKKISQDAASPRLPLRKKAEQNQLQTQFIEQKFKLSVCEYSIIKITSHEDLHTPKQPSLKLADRQKMILAECEHFTSRKLNEMIDSQRMKIDRLAKLTFERQLTFSQRRDVLDDISNIMSANFRFDDPKVKTIPMQYFIKSERKFRLFSRHFSIDNLAAELTNQFHSQLHEIDTVDASYKVFTEDVFKGGVEIFRQKAENGISDFCLQGEMMVLALQSRGMRELNIVKTIQYRNRSTNGLELVDEELNSWYDCLHRYDPYSQITQIPKSTSSLQAFLTQRVDRPKQSQLLTKVDIDKMTWDGVSQAMYSKIKSKLEITHEDYTNAVANHPKLPLYLTGNARGVVCLWSFNQQQDHSVDQWFIEPEVPWASASAKKSTVKSIQFTPYGDKFTALNMEGSLFTCNFDLTQSSKTQPIFRAKGLKLTDFTYLDPNGVIAALSYSNKEINILDSLIQNQPALKIKNVVGNIILADPVQQKLLVFNQKPGMVTEFDLRKQCAQVGSKQLFKEEITAALICGHLGSVIAVGFSDGYVRIFDLVTWDIKESIPCFVKVQGKTGSVTQLKSHSTTGALYASSTIGCVKLVRLSL